MDCPLTPKDIAELRAAVQRAHVGKPFAKPAVWIEYVDGPLEGIRIPSQNDLPPGSVHGWCSLTDKGAVQVMYRQREDGKWVFDYYFPREEDRVKRSPLFGHGAMPPGTWT